MLEGGTTSVKVALRIKPITEEDLEKLPTRFQRQVITSSGNQVIAEGEKRQIYHFDHVFPPETTQQEVYESAVENLVDKFLEGYNVTILAYGQTSSGKTHTMGTADNASVPQHSKGIIPRAIATLFNIMNTSSLYLDRKFSMKVSFIEIYNEDLIDLLGEGEGGPQVMIREDPKGNIYWSGLQEVHVNSVDEVISYLARGSLHRQVGATDMNAKSSRSHAIFSLTMSQQKLVSHNGGSRPTTPSSKLMGSRASSRANSRLDHDDGDWITITSKFHFVDLAGSERLKRTAASGDRAKEGISINSGLLALGNVISALGDPTKAKHTTHIPYRDSKLTRLLQDSLGGNAQTLMIACVSPAEFNLNETTNTLKYANRARNIKNIAAVNQEESGWNDIGHLQNLVIKLRSEITNLKVSLANSNSSNGTLSPGRVTPVGGRITPTNRMKSPTPGYHSSIPAGGRVTPSGRSTPTGIPGRSTPTSGIPGPGRSTPTSGIPGRSTPTSGIPGRSTPTSGMSGRKTPTGIPGRSTTPSGIPGGRKTPSGIPGRVTPTSDIRRRPTSPLTTFSQSNHHRDIEVLEGQLSQLERSYIELSRKYAKTSAELAVYQDNDGNEKNFMQLAEPIIEEYEKSITSLESKLSMTIAALSHAESVLKEQEDKVETLEKHREQTKGLNSNLQKYIKELEAKLEKRGNDTTSEPKPDVARGEHTEKFISETVRMLEEKLKERDAAYKELEKMLRTSGVDQDKQDLLSKINTRDKRISTLDTKLNQLGDEVEKLRKLEALQNSTTDVNSLNSSEQELLTIKSLEEKLRQTEIELSETRSKYEKQIQELRSHYDNNSEFTSTPITPMSPMTPIASQNEYNFKESSNINNTNVSSRVGVHRKAKSLSEKVDLDHAAIVEKLQFELKLFESFHKDKQQNLDKVKHELNLLEIDYQQTLQLVDELREELKKRENSEVESKPDNSIQEELEQLRVKQNQLLQDITERETENNKKAGEIERLESNIRDLRKQMDENEEIIILRERVAKLQAENISSIDHENTIKRLENELKEVKEAHKLAIQDKKLTIAPKDITSNDETSADKLEQNVDENVIVLEDTVKNLESQLKKARENVDQDLVNTLQSHLSSLKLEIKNKDDLIKQELENKDLLQKNLKDKETELAITTKQMMDLRKQGEDMQRRMKELQIQLGNAEEIKEINKSLEDDLDNIKKELMNVKEKEAQALEQLQLLDAEESKLKQELDRLRIVEITQQERIVVLEAQLSEQGAQIDSELINVKSELAISKESEITNKQTIAELESKFNKSESIISTLQSEIELLNSKENETLVELRKELSDTKSEMNSQNELLSALENQLITTEKERDQHSDRANELSRIIEEQESQLKEEAKTLELTITNLKSELNDANTISQTYQDKMKSLGEKLSDLEVQLDETKASNEEHVQKIDDLNSTLNESNIHLTEKQELILTKETLIKELEATIEKINEKLADAELSKTSESEHVISLRNKIAEIEDKLEQSPSPADLESAQQHAAKQAELVKELERKIDEINEINSSEAAKLNESINNLSKELKDTESFIHELDSELKKKEEKLAELEEMLNSVNSELSEKNEYSIALQKEIDSMAKELTDIATKYKDADILSKEYKAQISELEAALEEAKKLSSDKQNSVNSELSEKNEHSIALQKEIDSMAKELTDIATKYKDADILSKEYKAQISELEAALEEAKKLSSDKQKTEETLETSDKISSNDTTTQQDNLIKSLQEKIVELERRTLDDSAEHTQSNPIREVEIKELNQKISNLEEVNQERSELIESLEGLIKENGAEIEESKQKLEMLQEEKEKLVNEIESLKGELEEKRNKHEREKEEIQSMLKAKRESEVANLQDQIEELKVAKKGRLMKFMCF